MSFVDEYRDEKPARALLRRDRARRHAPLDADGDLRRADPHAACARASTGCCPEKITLVHGPGCPVCVTPLEQIDRALAIAAAARGDLHLLRRHAARARLRDRPARGQVRGRRRAHRLLAARRGEARRSATRTARSSSSPSASRPRRRPTPWRSGKRAKLGLANFSVLVSHVLVPPAMEAILGSPHNQVQGFLAAGHVCAVMGYWEYEPIAERYRHPDRRHRLRAARPARRGSG